MRLKRASGAPVFQVIFLSFIVCAAFEALETMVNHLGGDNRQPQTGNDHHLRDNPSRHNGCDALTNTTMSCTDIISHKSPQLSSAGVPDNNNRRRTRTKSQWFPIILLADAIRLVRLDAPERIQMGQTLRLRCFYETKGDKLQSLSWYKNGREFYRYQPFERRQPVLTFSLTGIHVDLIRSRNNTVFLTNTTLDTSGRYKCEATATTFQEVNMDTYVHVVAKETDSGGSSVRLQSSWRMLMFLITTVLIII